MRYLVEYLEPKTGKPVMGTFGRFFVDYKSDRNMFRYAHLKLRNGVFPAGQYQVTVKDGRVVGYLYKLA